MRRALRAFLMTLGVVALVASVLPLWAALFSGLLVRHLVVPALAERLERPVSLVRARGGVGRLEIEGLRIDEPAFGGRPALVAERVAISYRTAALYHGELSISGVSVRGAELTVYVRDGQSSLGPIVEKLRRRGRGEPRGPGRVHLDPDADIDLKGRAALVGEPARGRIAEVAVKSAGEPNAYRVALAGIDARYPGLVQGRLDRVEFTLRPGRRIPVEGVKVEGPEAEVAAGALLRLAGQRLKDRAGRAVERARDRLLRRLGGEVE